MTASVHFWLTLTIVSVLLKVAIVASETPSAQLPVEARNNVGSGSVEDEEDVIATSYVLPNQIFNDGKPYYAGKDPISGQLDFSAKKTAGIETAANEVYDPKEKIVLSSTSPNIHDFLNLPVKYSSSKFVYPLVSSSYANLKYQGNNKNYVTNKKPTSVAAPPPLTPRPASAPHYYTVPTTKLMAIAPTSSTAATISSSSSSTASTTTTISTSKKPTTISTIGTTTSTKQPSRPPLSTRYTTSTRKPIPISTTMSTTPHTTTSATRKKFVPTKKYIPTTSTTPSALSFSSPPAVPVRFPDGKPLNATATTVTIPTTASNVSSSKQTKPTTGSKESTPTHVSSIAPNTNNRQNAAGTRQPITFTTALPSLSQKPPGGSTRLPNLDAGAVYQTLGHKHTDKNAPGPSKPPSMTLADIFNSLAEEESALAANNQAPGQGLDVHGNLMQPIEPSRPAPFAMRGQRPALLHTTRPSFGSSTAGRPLSTNSETMPTNQESYRDEYVSYQVQQPNVMQYHPVPGTINNVVISPGQHSASFVLGSQQQVSTSGFGTIQKEPLFGKPPPAPVQYGTVINEDIGGPKLPIAVAATQASGVINGNGHQNGNFGQALSGVSQSSTSPFAVQPVVYQEAPPAPPSPYQQLPLINSNSKRQKPKPVDQSPQAINNYQHSLQPTALPQHATTTRSSQQNTPPQDTKEILISSNIRFPANSEDRSEEMPTGPVAAGPPAEPHVNGHAQPLSLQQIQSANPVIFPKADESSATGALSNEFQIQRHEVLTINQHKQKLNFPSEQPQSNNEPSQHMEPPPLLTGAEHAEAPNRPHGSQQYAYNEFTRKPIAGIARPNPERHLPNILPQFRPNAKISSGQVASGNFNQEPGNIHVPGGAPLKRPSGPGGPQFAHRRQPLSQQQQKRYPSSRIADYPPHNEAASNRRIYRLPPSYGGNYARRPGNPLPHMLRTADSYAIERHAPQTGSPKYQIPERMAAFETEDLVINDPPRPVTPSKDVAPVKKSKLEPVVTLQMLQSHNKAVTLSTAEDTGAGEIQVPPADEADSASAPPNQNELYVVYPMKTGQLETVAENVTKETETPSGSGVYQNTPFTVVREPQEPILTLKNKKLPQSLQQHHQHQQQVKSEIVKDKFPYTIEKPDPSYAELTQSASARVPGVLIAPRIASGATGSDTASAPIAIAYTPTEPDPYRRYSNVNLATPVIGEIRPESTHPDNDFDLRGQYYEKDFMAPFYPSISVDSDANAKLSNTNQLHNTNQQSTTSTTDKPLFYAKSNIDRADVVDEAAKEAINAAAALEATTKPFTMDHFQPELQGGFKPIYPAGYNSEGGDDSGDGTENHYEKPLALASRMEFPNALTAQNNNSTSTTVAPKPKTTVPSTVAPTQTDTPIQPKKSVLETSLEALLFGDDDPEDTEDEVTRKKQSKTIVGSNDGKMQLVPRMGPRSLKLSLT